jgi:2-haloacid dehalogenase
LISAALALVIAGVTRAQTSTAKTVAAHDWDMTGALCAGLRAAFVARPGKVLNPLGARPDIVGRDLREIAPRIVEMDVSA